MKKIIISSILMLFCLSFYLPVLAAAPAADLTCMQNAVDKRDSAIITAWDKYSAAAKSALEVRKAALKSAWAITDKTQRVTAIRKAWNDYKAAIKSARKAFASEKKAVWKTWKTDAKACKGNAEDKTSESVDNTL